MEWITHEERSLYESPWVSLGLADVEVPGGPRFDHHVVHMSPAAAVIAHDPGRGVLMLWRHRFITDTWGWEIPAGRVEADEDVEEAARREAVEETGWAPNELVPLVKFFPVNGISDHEFHIFVTNGATHLGEPSDPSEADRIEWVPVDELRRALAAGEVHDGLTLTSLCYLLAIGVPA